MQETKTHLKDSRGNRLMKQSVIGLSVGIAFSSFVALSSCATNPTPEVIDQISEPITIPTPPDLNDVLPNPIDDSDFNNPLTDLDPVIPTIRIAKPVPGRPGHVFNPYTQNMVDVEGVPSGTKVRDPQDDNEAHTFYVPAFLGRTAGMASSRHNANTCKSNE